MFNLNGLMGAVVVAVAVTGGAVGTASAEGYHVDRVAHMGGWVNSRFLEMGEPL